MHRPFIVAVTGQPGSGKTTLAHRLANQVHCPALCRDEFKEGYVHTMGSSHGSLGKDINWRLYEAFFETVSFVISKGISIIIEAAFQHKLWVPQLTSLTEIADVSIIVCTTSTELIGSRLVERELLNPNRKYFHGDQAIQIARQNTDFSGGAYVPPTMDLPTLAVDTTDGYRPRLDKNRELCLSVCNLIDSMTKLVKRSRVFLWRKRNWKMHIESKRMTQSSKRKFLFGTLLWVMV